MFPVFSFAQQRWDGEGLDGRWDNPTNWQPDGVPTAGSMVLLDNSQAAGSYTVTLPPGNVMVDLASLQVLPATGMRIVLVLPRENTAAPGLRITGADESLVLGPGATLRNASGASSGETLQVLGTFRIANDGRYIHQTPRGNASLIDRLSQGPGTETGIFEFDVPGTAGYTVSLTGNTFGTLVFSASAAGGTKSYSGSGASALRIRGNWVIQPGATITTTLSANIILEGSLQAEGSLQMMPSTAGTSGRSLVCQSANGQIFGAGSLALQANFREIVIAPGARYTMARSLALPFAQNHMRVNAGGELHLGNQVISGAGRFSLDAGGRLSIGHAAGISATGPSGQITTATRSFSPAAAYRYSGDTDQETGTGLPGTAAVLTVDKASGNLRVSNNVTVTDTLSLQRGILRSNQTAMLSLDGALVVSPRNAYGNMDEGWEGSYVEGPVQYFSEGPGRQTLPVGKDGAFAPLRILRETEGRVGYIVEYHDQAYTRLVPVNPANLRKVSALEYWSVSATGTTAAIPARIALSWRPSSDVGEGDAAKSELRVGHYTALGSDWQWDALGVQPAWQGTNDFGWLESDQPAADFQAFTLASAGALNLLPLRRLSLYAEPSPKGTILRCIPEGEGSCPPLQLERSPDGRNFHPIGGRTPEKACGQEVAWIDSFPLSPSSYYRVRQADGLLSIFSPVVRVITPPDAQPRLYPNPVEGQLMIHFPGLRSGTPAMIVQMDGKGVKEILLAGEDHIEDVSTLKPGRYYLMVKHPNGRVVLPFLKR